MIKIEKLKVSAGDKEILKGVSLNFEIGKNYCLLGRNGSGKSSLSSFLMGNPVYKYESGSVKLIGQTQGTAPTENSRGEPCVHPKNINLLELSPEERSSEGLFLSFQNVPEIMGIKLSEYLRTIYNISKTKPPLTPPYEGGGHEKTPFLHKEGQGGGFKGLSPFMFKRFIKKYLQELHIDEKFLERDLNVGFSGGEKRKIEILQMKLIGPKYIILDEIDSGLDLDAFRKVAELLKSISNDKNSLIIITHYFKILDYIDVDEVYVLKNGEVIKKGGSELAKKISEEGFENI